MNEQPLPRRSKRWKLILGIAAIVVFSLILAVVAILSRLDFDRLKPLLTQVVKQETGRDLDSRGPIDFKLGLRPSILMEDISFQNAPWAWTPEMVKIKRLEATIAVIPLLNRDIQITRLVLTEPDILLETDKSGRWNLEFQKHKAPDRKVPTTGGSSLPKMTFYGVRIEAGQVSYRLGATGKGYRISLDRFILTSEGVDSPMALAEPSLQIDAAQTMIAAGKAAGGVLLFGPAGIAAALACPSSDEGNPCLSAIEAARKGLRTSERSKGEEEKGKSEKSLTGTLRSVGEGIKRFFSVQGTQPQSERPPDPSGGGGP